MSNEFNKEAFVAVAKDKLDEAKEIMKNQMCFNPKGIEEMVKEKPAESGGFFTKLIGETFDSEKEEHITKVLEAGFKTPESMGEVMEFLYNNFNEEKSSTKETVVDNSPKKTSVATERKLRQKKDWASMEIPFTANSMQYVVFDELRKFDGTLQEFTEHVTKVFSEKNIVSKSIPMIIDITVTNAQERGWDVDLKHGDAKKVHLAKKVTVS